MAKEFTYQGCPFCAWQRFVKDEPHFDRIDPSEVKAISRRVFTGRIKGGPRKGSMRTISDIRLSQLPAKYKEQIKIQAQRILDAIEE